MKALYLAAALAAVTMLGVLPASATPATQGTAAQSASPMLLAQAGRPNRGDRHARSRRPSRPRYVPGRRYRSAPRGWHRYRHRPGNWHRRGCILVGPLWFCP